MKRIELQHEPPRDLEAIQGTVDLRKGLRVYVAFGYAFAVGAVVVAASSLLPPYDPGLIVIRVVGGLLFFGGFAVLLLRNARQTYQRRVNALRNGVAIEAKVVEHRRTFVFWKSTRDYVVIVRIEGSRGGGMAKIRSSRAELHEQLPIGSRVIGLFDAERDQTVFLESMGYTLGTSGGE